MKIAFILLISACATAILGSSRLAVTLFALALDAPPLTVGVLVALYSALPIFVSLSIGRTIDRVGARGPLALTGIAAIAGCLLPYAIPQIWSLAVSACLIGLSFMTMSISLNVLVPQMGSASERTVNYTWYALGSSAGMAAGPLLAGFGIEHLGHRATFLLLTAVPVVLLATLAAGGRFFPPPSPHAARAQGRLLDMLRERSVRVPLVGSALAPIVLDMYFFVVPLYATGIGIGASTIGIILGCCSGAALSVRALLPLLVTRMREWSMVGVTFMVTGAVFVLLPHAPGTPLLILLSLIAGVSTGVSAPVVISPLYTALPQGRQAEGIGVRAVLMSSGQVVAPTLVNGLSTLLGLAPVLAVCGAGVIIYGWIARAQRSHSR